MKSLHLWKRFIREHDFPFQLNPSCLRSALMIPISMLTPIFLRIDCISELVNGSLRVPLFSLLCVSVIACLRVNISFAIIIKRDLLTSGILVMRELLVVLVTALKGLLGFLGASSLTIVSLI